MGSSSQDTYAEFEMLIDAYMALRAKKSKHKLLKLASLSADNQGMIFQAAYDEKYVFPFNCKYKIFGYRRYRLDLENAL